MKKALLALLLLAPLPAQAQSSYVIRDGNGVLRTIKAFNCSSTICPGSVPMDAAGAALTGAPGTPSGSALTIQGVAGGVPLPIAPPASLPLPAGASTAALQTSGGAKTQIVDGAGNVVGTTGTGLNVQCANCTSSSATDATTFTPGGTGFGAAGGFYQTAPTNNGLSNGQQGAFQVTQNRALFTNLRNAAGTELATAGAPLRVDPTGTTTQPVSIAAAITANLGTLNGAALDASIGTTNTDLGAPGATACATDTGSCSLNALLQRLAQRLTTLNTTLGSPMQATGGTVTANAGSGTFTVTDAALTRAQGSATSGQTGPLIQGAVTTAAPAYTTAQTSPLSLTPAGLLRVDGSGATQPISGTITANAGTNLNTSALALDATLGTTNTDLGAPGATACATDTGSCSLNALAQRLAQRLTTLNTTLGTPLQAGGNLGTVTAVTGITNQVHTICDSGCSGSSAPADESAFTAGTTSFGITGGFFQTTATNNALTTGQMGAFQVTANRALFANLRNAAGTEVGTSTTPLQVTGANGTFPVTATNLSSNLAQVAGTATDTNSGNVSAGTIRVVLATNQPALTNKLLVTPDLPTGASTAANQTSPNTPIAAATATATVGRLIGGQYDSTQKTLTNGQQAAYSMSARGALMVATGADTFTVSAAQSGNWTARVVGNAGGVVDFAGQNATVPANALLAGCGFNTSPTTITSGNASPLQCDTSGKLLVNPGTVTVTATNLSTNVAQINGVTPLMGNGTSGTGSPRVSIASDNSAVAGLGVGATGSAVPANAVLQGVSNGGNTTAIVGDPCQTVAKSYTPINISTATTTRIIAPAASKKTYICHMFLLAAGTTNVGVVEGTGGTCGTGTAGVIGGTTAATGPNLTAQAGFVLGTGGFAAVGTAGSNVDFCLITSAAIQISGNVAYVQQ